MLKTVDEIDRYGRRLFRLSIVVPAYNEEATVGAVVRSLLAVELPCPIEVVVVDDGSRDRTPHILAGIDDERVNVVRHPRNFGKGAALLTGIEMATGTHLLPFDADMEYDAADIPALVRPVQQGRADVVYGCRLFGCNTVYQSYRYAMGNRLTTLATNVLFDSSVSDLHTCLKLVPLDLVRSLRLGETGFGFDTELTARILKAGHRPFEVPVSYHSRSHEDGKKLTWRDGVRCLAVLGRVRLSADREQSWPAYPEMIPRRWAPSPRSGASGRHPLVGEASALPAEGV